MSTRELTKWPRLPVVGKRITEEQANEILIRTNQWFFSTNDKEWQAKTDVHRAVRR